MAKDSVELIVLELRLIVIVIVIGVRLHFMDGLGIFLDYDDLSIL